MKPRKPHLDGMRCLAVISVMAYHSGVPGFSAGFFGVDIFFVLSGYLITGLLLGEGRPRLGRFWGRRARRLLPGLLIMLLAVEVYVRFWAPAGRYPGIGGDVVSVLFYYSNWHLIAGSSNYFAAGAAPSLLTHTWSLAIEEQFYIVWPAMVAVIARWRGPAASVRWVLGIACVGAGASAAWMAALAAEGTSVSRLYYGTDTHCQCLLVGSALAAWLARRPPPQWTIWGSVPLGGLALLIAFTGSRPEAYRGGFLAVSLLTAALILTCESRPTQGTATFLSNPVFRFVGRISYGMYLWYFPLFAVITGSSTGTSGLTLFTIRTVVDVAVATASFYLVERAVHDGRSIRWPTLGGVAAGAAAVAMVVAGAPAANAVTVPLPADPPGGSQRQPVRILVTGDSLSLTLGLGWTDPDLETHYGIVVQDDGHLGCGVAISASVLEHSTPTPPAPGCTSSEPAARQWPAELAEELSRFRPDIVVFAAGRTEVDARRATADSPWVDITQPADEQYIRHQLDEVITIAAGYGAKVALATAPCFSSGEKPDGAPWPEDSAARLGAYNRAVRQAVDDHPGLAYVVDVGAAVCPGGRFETTIGGVTVRSPDGIHYPYFSIGSPRQEDPNTYAQTLTFGRWLAARLMPQIIEAATT